MNRTSTDPERKRQAEGRDWEAWGPYSSERHWGTVREDYSPHGTAWEYFPHDHARSRAYRWGEDGLGGFSDDRARMCVAIALWNERDPILKERLFGLTNSEANHGEDVKELYYYLDATPTHSYLRMLYKYPQAAFPYTDLVAENRRCNNQQLEYELVDTGEFDDDRYFDVEIECAKADAEDFLLQVTVHNRGPETATIHVLPHVWLRNAWSWTHGAPKPWLRSLKPGLVHAEHPELGEFRISFDGARDVYFCDNETNMARVFGAPPIQGYFKDAIHERVIHADVRAANPDLIGTKSAAHHVFSVAGGSSAHAHPAAGEKGAPFADFYALFDLRRAEADRFYEVLQEGIASADERLVQRQTLGGMIWTKQYYFYDVAQWLRGDPG